MTILFKKSIKKSKENSVFLFYHLGYSHAQRTRFNHASGNPETVAGQMEIIWKKSCSYLQLWEHPLYIISNSADLFVSVSCLR